MVRYEIVDVTQNPPALQNLNYYRGLAYRGHILGAPALNFDSSKVLVARHDKDDHIVSGLFFTEYSQISQIKGARRGIRSAKGIRDILKNAGAGKASRIVEIDDIFVSETKGKGLGTDLVNQLRSRFASSDGSVFVFGVVNNGDTQGKAFAQHVGGQLLNSKENGTIYGASI